MSSTPAPSQSPGVSAPLNDLPSILAEAKGKPCRVHEVFVEGNERTKLSVIERELEDVFAATTLEEVHDTAARAALKLQDLGAFAATEVELNTSDTGGPGTCDVVVSVEERGWKNFHAGTFVQGQSCSMEVSGQVRNVLGNCETLSVSAEVGSANNVEYAIKYVQPRVYGSDWHSSMALHQVTRSHEKHSSYVDRLRGAVAALTSTDGAHKLAYELAWRHVSDPTHCASAAVRQQCGHNLKSSVSHSFLADTRDDRVQPGHGVAFAARTEVAGLSPDSNILRFLKHTAEWQGCSTLAPGVTATVDASIGVMLPWGSGTRRPAKQATAISERFLLGGASSLRGFHHNSAGPTDARRAPHPPGGEGPTAPAPVGRDFTGGDLRATAMAALNVDLPFGVLKDGGVFVHAFLNAGNLLAVSGSGGGVWDRLEEFRASYRSAAGVGVVLPVAGVGRIEVNYVTTLRQQRQDRARHGLQVSFAAAGFAPLSP